MFRAVTWLLPKDQKGPSSTYASRGALGSALLCTDVHQFSGHSGLSSKHFRELRVRSASFRHMTLQKSDLEFFLKPKCSILLILPTWPHKIFRKISHQHSYYTLQKGLGNSTYQETSNTCRMFSLTFTHSEKETERYAFFPILTPVSTQDRRVSLTSDGFLLNRKMR